MKAETNMIQDGQFYQKGDEVWDLGSWVAVEIRSSVRHYKGLAADVPKLPRYAGTGSTAECLDTGEVYKYEKTTGRWYLSSTGGGGGGSGGSDGFSPIAAVTQKDGTTTITITDRYGTTTAEIKESGKTYEFTQDIPQKVWTVTHSLNRQYPDVLCIDENGDTICGEVDYYSQNVTMIRFNTEVKGRAFVK